VTLRSLGGTQATISQPFEQAHATKLYVCPATHPRPFFVPVSWLCYGTIACSFLVPRYSHHPGVRSCPSLHHRCSGVRARVSGRVPMLRPPTHLTGARGQGWGLHCEGAEGRRPRRICRPDLCLCRTLRRVTPAVLNRSVLPLSLSRPRPSKSDRGLALVPTCARKMQHLISRGVWGGVCGAVQLLPVWDVRFGRIILG
jgi:hypothetical protein